MLTNRIQEHGREHDCKIKGTMVRGDVSFSQGKGPGTFLCFLLER